MKKKPVLDVQSQFDLMVKFQTAIESKSVIVQNSPKCKFAFSLYEISAPYPTFEEYLEGNDFNEGDPINHSSDIVQLEHSQAVRRNIFSGIMVLA